MRLITPLGYTVAFTFREGHLTRMEDGAGHIVEYRYDKGLLTEVVHMDGGISRYAYTSEGYLETSTDQTGLTYLTNVYDEKGRVVKQTLAEKAALKRVEVLQAKIDQTEYWDLEILDFNIEFFGDEVNIFVYNDADTSWKIAFLSCFKVTYETDATWRSITKLREMKKPQLGYFGQDITLSENKEYEGFYDVSIDLTIMIAKIICKDVNVEVVSNNTLDIFWWKDGD